MAFAILKSAPKVSGIKNPIAYQVQAAANWKTFDKYEIWAWVLEEISFKSGTWSPILTIKQTPDPQNKVAFDLSGILEGSLAAEPPTTQHSAAIKRLEKSFRRYFIFFLEYTDNTLTNGLSVIWPSALRAGRNEHTGQELESYFKNGRFLTHQPNPKNSRASAPEWLTFGIPEGFVTGNIQLMAKVYYEDGTDSGDLSGGIYTASELEVLQIPVGYNMLNLGLNPAPDKVVGYEVWIKDVIKGTALSEVWYYNFDHCECGPLDRYFLFENSLGGWDTIRTRGEAKVSYQTQGQRAQKILSPFRTGINRASQSYGSNYGQKISQATGFNTATEQAWYLDFLNSDEVLRIGGHGPNPEGEGAFIPIELEKGEFQFFQDNVFIQGLTFSYTEATTHRAL